jgi:phenylacetate-coenzyme A ligase PaaK-like adenylate-forming protein
LISHTDIFNIQNQKQFDKMALQVFRYQYENNAVYNEFCNYLKTDVHKVKTIEQIPFLPIQFFKSHAVVSNTNPVMATFTSSGTTGQITSKHLVTDVSMYEESYTKAFSQFYGDIENYVVLALLPSYLEREGSSLIYMVNDLIVKTKNPNSGFYLHNYSEFIDKLTTLDGQEQNVLVIGVTFALLDVLEQHQFSLKNTIIMETGGMKGKRKEIIREELHKILTKGFGVTAIHSEYGMTELLSQAYSLGNGIFELPNWMQILVRDTEDAKNYVGKNKTGGLNIIDLANINSCSFIATQDLGKMYSNNTFEVLGRFDNSDIRGCNLMVL